MLIERDTGKNLLCELILTELSPPDLPALSAVGTQGPQAVP